MRENFRSPIAAVMYLFTAVVYTILYPGMWYQDSLVPLLYIAAAIGFFIFFGFQLFYPGKPLNSFENVAFISLLVSSSLILISAIIANPFYESKLSDFPSGSFYTFIASAILALVIGGIMLWKKRIRVHEVNDLHVQKKELVKINDDPGPNEQNIVIKSHLSEEDKKVVTEMMQYGIITKSKLLVEAFNEIKVHADSNISILITGASGTGKELFAQAVHKLSGRKGNMVSRNAADISNNLIEPELFGYKKGSHDKADMDKDGLIKIADHGTLFFDEVADMSEELQNKLLRVLQEKEFYPVGANTPESVDIRLVSATDKDLDSLQRDGDFREAMFHRRGGVRIHLPPLKDRVEDIPDLCIYLFNKFKDELNWDTEFKPTEEDFRLLTSEEWPGNIRDLGNFVQRVLNRFKKKDYHTQSVFRQIIFEEKQKLREQEREDSSQSVCFGRLDEYHLLETFSVYIDCDFSRKATSEYLSKNEHTVDVDVNTSMLIYADENGKDNVDEILNMMLLDGFRIDGKSDQFTKLIKSKIQKCLKWEQTSQSKKPFKNPGDEIVARLKSITGDLTTP